MTAEQIYEKTGSDYAGATMRLRKHTLLIRLLKMFPSDPSMGELNAAVEKGDPVSAFRAVHTLKGVALNFGFTVLAEKSSALTELLRAGAFSDGWESAYEAVKLAYKELTEALQLLEE